MARRGRRETVRVCVEIDLDTYQALRDAFGNVRAGVERILRGWAWQQLGPRDEKLRRAWEALKARGRRLRIRDAVSTVASAVGTDEQGAFKVLQELSMLGYVNFLGDGTVEVVYGSLPEDVKVLMMLGLLQR